MDTSLLKKLVADQCFLLFSGGDIKIKAYTQQTKAIRKTKVAVRENNGLETANMTLRTSISASPETATK